LIEELFGTSQVHRKEIAEAIVDRRISTTVVLATTSSYLLLISKETRKKINNRKIKKLADSLRNRIDITKSPS